VGVFVFPSLAREYEKVKGGHTVGEVDMFGDPWKDGRVSLWFIHTPVLSLVVRE